MAPGLRLNFTCASIDELAIAADRLVAVINDRCGDH